MLSIAAIAMLLPSAITTDATVTNDPESEQGYAAMFRHLPPSDDFVNEVVLARAPGKDVTTDRNSQLEIERLASALQATGRTAQVRSYFDDEDPSLISPDRDAVVITIGMGPDAEDGIKDVIDVVRQADRGPLEVTVTGEFTADEDFLTLSNKDLKEGELFFGLPAAMVVLLFVFGAVVAGCRADRARDRRHRRRTRSRRDRRAGLGGVVLRRQHAHGHGARARRRLLPLRRQPLPRGAGERRREGRGDHGDGADGEPGGALQWDGVRDRADRDAARAGHDPAQPRCRGDPRGLDGSRRRDNSPARDPLATRRPRELPAAAVRRSAAARARRASGAPSSTASSGGRSRTCSSRPPSSSCSPCRRSTCGRARRVCARSRTATRRRTASTRSSASSGSAPSTRRRSSSRAT